MESMMEMKRCTWLSKLSIMEKSQDLQGECSTYRETTADHTPCLHKALIRLDF
jgi:hypothetical protein